MKHGIMSFGTAYDRTPKPPHLPAQPSLAGNPNFFLYHPFKHPEDETRATLITFLNKRRFFILTLHTLREGPIAWLDEHLPDAPVPSLSLETWRRSIQVLDEHIMKVDDVLLRTERIDPTKFLDEEVKLFNVVQASRQKLFEPMLAKVRDRKMYEVIQDVITTMLHIESVFEHVYPQ